MKYIRTTDGICENFPRAAIWPSNEALRLLKPIIKQSDNIKDLCEAFVFEDANAYPESASYIDPKSIWKMPFSKVLDLLEFRLSQGGDVNLIKIYGAIWTDKGLIYVAKMNDRRELELL